MKKKIIIATSVLLLLGVVTLAFSWKELLLKLGGYHTPQLETAVSLAAFARQHGGAAHFMAIAADRNSHNYLRKNFGTPGLVIFDKQLLPVNSSNAIGCPNTTRHFLSTIDTAAHYSANHKNLSLHDMNDVMKGISFVSGDSAQFRALLESGTVDYIAIYAWAKYLPKQSAHMMKGVADIAGKKKNILVLSLNLDYPAQWMSQDSLDKENSAMEIKFASN